MHTNERTCIHVAMHYPYSIYEVTERYEYSYLIYSRYFDCVFLCVVCSSDVQIKKHARYFLSICFDLHDRKYQNLKLNKAVNV